jgi:hypothetical protein
MRQGFPPLDTRRRKDRLKFPTWLWKRRTANPTVAPCEVVEVNQVSGSLHVVALNHYEKYAVDRKAQNKTITPRNKNKMVWGEKVRLTLSVVPRRSAAAYTSRPVTGWGAVVQKKP